MTLSVNDEIRLELLNDSHAGALLQLRNDNVQHLRQWLTWVDQMQTVMHFQQFIADCHKRYEEGNELPLIIMVDGKAAGRIGLNFINPYYQSASIGYWLGKDFEGRGIITQACRQVIEYAFMEMNLNRLELRCGTGNLRSAAIAERLRFTKEGIIRQGEKVNGQFIDLNLYSLLQQEWKGAPNE